MVECSPEMRAYFDSLEAEFGNAMSVSTLARGRGLDAREFVEIAPAADVAARVEGLVGPKGVAERIREIILQGKKREEACFEIAKEILQQKFLPEQERVETVSQELKEQLIEQAIRSGLALFTEGVVSAPIEGVSKVQIRKNFDGSTYVAVFFSGPIRGAGGTGQAFTLLLADACRKFFQLENFRPLEDQVERYVEELNLYARKTRAGQYVPKEDEIRHVARSCPVCIDGEPTEDYEVSKYKNVKDVATNRVRGGVALVVSEGLCLKAAKVLKISKKAGLDWQWIEKLIKVSKNEAEKIEIKPVEKYIDEIVAGRPIFSYPMAQGGFRLRYGRTRFTGIASKAIHPATMALLDDFTAIGTQVKVERPGKGCIVTPCEEIDGPIALLKGGEVRQIYSEKEAREIAPQVEKVLFLGDLLVNYGDFSKANHPLVQGAWCEEWYALLLEKAGVKKTIPEIKQMTAQESIALAREKGVPLAPRHTFFYHDLPPAELKELCDWLCLGHLLYDWFEFKGYKTADLSKKQLLEKLGVPHTVSGESAVLDAEHGLALLTTLGLFESPSEKMISTKKLEKHFPGATDAMQLVNKLAGFNVMKKAGIYVGASMGRPEKAKERKMQPPVHALFPIGEHGGKMRSIPKAIRNLRDSPNGNATAELEVVHRVCPLCGKATLGAKCPSCNVRAKIMASCSACGKPVTDGDEKCKCGGNVQQYEKKQVDVATEFKNACEKVSFHPTELKGVIGLISSSRTPEPLEKGVLRAKHNVYVFRDGTCRFDATEVPLTHFTPGEIGLSLEKLSELGYVHDILGNPVTSLEQTIELRPQDIILSEYGGDYMLRLASFVDDELVYLYGSKPYYNAKTRNDLIGKQAIVIAPHTSAGILGRLIGFTKIRGILAHPYLHCATRRNCISGNELVYYENDSTTHAETMEQAFEKYAGLFGATRQGGFEAVDVFGKRDLFAFGANSDGVAEKARIKTISRRWHEGKMLKLRAENGQEIKLTPGHVVWTWDGSKLVEKAAGELKEGDVLASLAFANAPQNVPPEIDLLGAFKETRHAQSLSVRTSKEFCFSTVKKFSGMKKLQEFLGITKIQLKNYFFRAPYAIPLEQYLKIRDASAEQAFAVGFKRNFGAVPLKVALSDGLFKLLGYYVSEGWAWQSKVKGKDSFHLGFAASVPLVRDEIARLLRDSFGITPTISQKDVVVTSKVLYSFFTETLNLGHGAYEKQIPEIALSASQSQKFAFISGCFQGDAHIAVLEAKYCTVSEKLAAQMNFLLASLGISSTFKKEKKIVKSGIVFQKYTAKGKIPPESVLHYVCVYSSDLEKLCSNLKLVGSKEKSAENICKKRGRRLLKKHKDIILSKVKEIAECDCKEFVYDFELEKGKEKIFAAGKGMLLVHNCDGDEDCVILLLDGLLNFSKSFLPETRGGQMDAPLVLTTVLDPKEVDDEVHAMDACTSYPLEFYEATMKNASPSDVKLDTISTRLGKPSQYEGIGFTHRATIAGPVQSKYVQLGDMAEKVSEELALMGRIRAVDLKNATERILLSHFLPDIYGNLRKFSKQSFRCGGCNAKYRRVPLSGTCRKCGGKLLLTINKGGIQKYLHLSQQLVEKYGLPHYLAQRLMLIEREIGSIFEDDKVKQFSLADYV